ncbi:MAG: type II toxin-antitoxin system RelE/ParE family toxin [Candidatus Nanohaloarchaea archaeon]
MELAIPDVFLEELSSFDATVQEAVFDKLEELEEDGTGLDDVGIASRTDMDIEVFRLAVKDADHGIDHRVIFDIIDGTAYPVAVGHRDDVYETGNWKTVEERLRTL